MAIRKSQVVSLGSLARSIDRAVKIATKRRELNVERATLLDKWEIFGRRVRGEVDLSEAFRFAQDVTRNVSAQGIKAEPACVKIGPDILVGFIERAQLPRVLSR